MRPDDSPEIDPTKSDASESSPGGGPSITNGAANRGDYLKVLRHFLGDDVLLYDEECRQRHGSLLDSILTSGQVTLEQKRQLAERLKVYRAAAADRDPDVQRLGVTVDRQVLERHICWMESILASYQTEMTVIQKQELDEYCKGEFLDWPGMVDIWPDREQ
jgi:hypothetical protein